MRLPLAAAAALLAAACAGPAPKESFYVLSAPPAPAAATARVTVKATVPEAVDRTAMVIRKGANEVDIDDANRWAEPLKSAVARVVAENLRRELGATPGEVRVAVEVQRFDSSFAEGATLDALWTATPASGPARNGRTVTTEPAAGGGAAGIAAAHSKALQTLAAEIAGALRR